MIVRTLLETHTCVAPEDLDIVLDLPVRALECAKLHKQLIDLGSFVYLFALVAPRPPRVF